MLILAIVWVSFWLFTIGAFTSKFEIDNKWKAYLMFPVASFFIWPLFLGGVWAGK